MKNKKKIVILVIILLLLIVGIVMFLIFGDKIDLRNLMGNTVAQNYYCEGGTYNSLSRKCSNGVKPIPYATADDFQIDYIINYDERRPMNMNPGSDIIKGTCAVDIYYNGDNEKYVGDLFTLKASNSSIKVLSNGGISFNNLEEPRVVRVADGTIRKNEVISFNIETTRLGKNYLIFQTSTGIKKKFTVNVVDANIRDLVETDSTDINEKYFAYASPRPHRYRDDVINISRNQIHYFYINFTTLNLSSSCPMEIRNWSYDFRYSQKLSQQAGNKVNITQKIASNGIPYYEISTVHKGKFTLVATVTSPEGVVTKRSFYFNAS